MSFSYVSGCPALDLAATVESRHTEPLDLLRTPADLERWVAACVGLPDRVNADGVTFTMALALRQAIYDLALARVGGGRFDTDSLAIVNDVADGPMPTVRLTDAGGGQTSGDLRSALTQVARDGIAVLSDSDATLKECGRTECSRIYLDRSRGSRRTWCGMDECGNRVKAAAYRARKRA